MYNVIGAHVMCRNKLNLIKQDFKNITIIIKAGIIYAKLLVHSGH